MTNLEIYWYLLQDNDYDDDVDNDVDDDVDNDVDNDLAMILITMLTKIWQ